MNSINGYQFIREIGQGSQSNVFLAENSEKNIVAIKVMRNTNLHAEIRLQNEETLLNQVEHPNLIPIFDSGTCNNGNHYMVMGYFESVSFADYMKQMKGLDLKAKIRIMRNVAKVLGAIHKHNYVHRDLKPSNILINSTTEEIRLTDFGVVQIPESTLTKVFNLVGTPAYLSPEGFQTPKVRPSADIYSLGAIAYEFFLGEPLFDFSKIRRSSDLGLKTISENPRAPFKIKKDFPTNLSKVLETMLKKNPESRYQNGYEAAKALDKVLKDGFKKTRIFVKKRWCTKKIK